MNLARFNKLWVAITTLAVLIVGNELGTDSKWYNYVVVGVGAFGVFFVPNKTEA